MPRFKYPFSIYIVWHPAFQAGLTIANQLYSVFCRDSDHPLSRGLGIPVFYRYMASRESDVPLLIDTTLSEQTAIIILVDQQMVNDDNGPFKDYIRGLNTLASRDIRIFPVALFQKAFSLGCGLGELQFTKAWLGPIEDLLLPANWELALSLMKTSLLHDCARLLMTETGAGNAPAVVPPAVKLFLSHAKLDGEQDTIKFKQFVDQEVKLNVFFDVHDIADGYDFGEQIKSNLIDTAVVVFHTDEYSNREWCRIEVLVAKRNKLPIVIVHNIKNGEKRTFPYLGNAPSIVRTGDDKINFRAIVDLTLRQIISNKYQHKLLKAITDFTGTADIDFIYIVSTPELFHYVEINRHKAVAGKDVVVLYPDPPLGAEELKLLADINSEIKFVTPVGLPALLARRTLTGALASEISEQGPFHGRQVAISISDGDILGPLGISANHLKDISVEIGRYMLANGSKLLYGGDMRSQGYIQIFSDLVRQYKLLDDRDRRFINYFTYLASRDLTANQRSQFVEDGVKPVDLPYPAELGIAPATAKLDLNDVQNRYINAFCLADMRSKMAEALNARICVGGKLKDFSGFYPGIIEEAFYTLKANKPIYLVGGFGGATRSIISVIKGTIPVELTFDYQNQTALARDFELYSNNKKSGSIDYESIIQFYQSFDTKAISAMNGLTTDENETLFQSTNILEIVLLLMKGLQNVFSRR